MSHHLTPGALARADQHAACARDRVDRDLAIVARHKINETPVDIARLSLIIAHRTCCLLHLADAYATALTRLADTSKENDR